ncbi:MAG: peptidoglycan editing factor PgeF [Candidatus Zapsychrus exili]|nr:peptidoglycan editing factor PgeF [Candidatus Zapsychrus exili]
MNNLFSNFFPENILAFVGTNEMDFFLSEDQGDLSEDQKKYLSVKLGFDVPAVVNIRQVHGNRVVLVDEKVDKYRAEEADAIITDLKNVPIAIRTADCLPVFVYSPAHEVVGIIHAGWRSTHKEIIKETLSLMSKEWKTEPHDIKMAFGPAIRVDSCDVEQSFKKYFDEEVVKKGDKYYFDLAQANKNQALKLGVKEDNIFDCGICTFKSQNYFSFRGGDVDKGRMISLMMIKE